MSTSARQQHSHALKHHRSAPAPQSEGARSGRIACRLPACCRSVLWVRAVTDQCPLGFDNPQQVLNTQLVSYSQCATSSTLEGTWEEKCRQRGRSRSLAACLLSQLSIHIGHTQQRPFLKFTIGFVTLFSVCRTLTLDLGPTTQVVKSRLARTSETSWRKCLEMSGPKRGRTACPGKANPVLQSYPRLVLSVGACTQLTKQWCLTRDHWWSNAPQYVIEGEYGPTICTQQVRWLAFHNHLDGTEDAVSRLSQEGQRVAVLIRHGDSNRNEYKDGRGRPDTGTSTRSSTNPRVIWPETVETKFCTTASRR